MTSDKNTSEKILLEKFRKILSFSNRISQQQTANMMDISMDELSKWLFRWSDHLSFKIDGEYILVSNMEGFLHDLDSMFSQWDDNPIEEKITNANSYTSTTPDDELRQNQGVYLPPRQLQSVYDNQTHFEIPDSQKEYSRFNIPAKIQELEESIENLTNWAWITLLFYPLSIALFIIRSRRKKELAMLQMGNIQQYNAVVSDPSRNLGWKAFGMWWAYAILGEFAWIAMFIAAVITDDPNEIPFLTMSIVMLSGIIFMMVIPTILAVNWHRRKSEEYNAQITYSKSFTFGKSLIIFILIYGLTIFLQMGLFTLFKIQATDPIYPFTLLSFLISFVTGIGGVRYGRKRHKKRYRINSF